MSAPQPHRSLWTLPAELLLESARQLRKRDRTIIQNCCLQEPLRHCFVHLRRAKIFSFSTRHFNHENLLFVSEDWTCFVPLIQNQIKCCSLGLMDTTSDQTAMTLCRHIITDRDTTSPLSFLCSDHWSLLLWLRGLKASLRSGHWLRGTLHSFILHWCDVFKARRRHVPVSAGLFLPGSPWRVATCRQMTK